MIEMGKKAPKDWKRHLLNLEPIIYEKLEKEGKKRGMDINNLIRSILYDYFYPKPGLKDQVIDAKIIQELLKEQEKMIRMEFQKIEKVQLLDSNIKQPLNEDELSLIESVCRIERSLFEISEKIEKSPEETLILLRWLIKKRKLREKDGKYKTIRF